MRSIVKTGLYNSVIFAVIILLFLNPSRNNYSSAENITLSILFTMFLITLGATISLYREKRKQKNQNSIHWKSSKNQRIILLIKSFKAQFS